MATRDVGGGNLVLQLCGQRPESGRLARRGLRTRQNDRRHSIRDRKHLDFFRRRRNSNKLATHRAAIDAEGVEVLRRPRAAYPQFAHRVR